MKDEVITDNFCISDHYPILILTEISTVEVWLIPNYRKCWKKKEKPAHLPLEPLVVALKHTGWMPPAYLYSLAESAKVEGRRIVNSDIN